MEVTKLPLESYSQAFTPVPYIPLNITCIPETDWNVYTFAAPSVEVPLIACPSSR